MTKEVNLQVPDSLFTSLLEQSIEQGVSFEALCLSLLSRGEQKSDRKITLVEPSLYSYMANGELRDEIQRVLQSELPKEEIRKRVQGLKLQISRCIR